MIKKNLILIILLSLFNCKNQQENENVLNKKTDTISTISEKKECDIPEEVLSYISSDKKFELLTIKDLKLLKGYVNTPLCSIYAKGDFNHNGNEDIAIIVRYKGYVNGEYPNYNFPFLIIFNDYKNEVKPTIIYKTGDYSDEPEKTVIYDQFEEGIFSYIETAKVCGEEVVRIVLPEKSTFYVYWNSNKSIYEFINSLDEDFCKKIQGSNSNGEDVVKTKKNDDLGSLSDDFKFENTWKSDCSNENESEFIFPDRNEGDFYMKNSNGGFIAKISVKYNPETKSIEYLGAQTISRKYKYFDWNIDIEPNTPIAVIKKGDNRKILLEWKGLYNSKTKKIEFQKNPFNQTNNSVILNNCDY